MYEEEELILPILIEKVPNNLFIIHNLAFHFIITYCYFLYLLDLYGCRAVLLVISFARLPLNLTVVLL